MAPEWRGATIAPEVYSAKRTGASQPSRRRRLHRVLKSLVRVVELVFPTKVGCVLATAVAAFSENALS
jgi:hypothetical protein